MTIAEQAIIQSAEEAMFPVQNPELQTVYDSLRAQLSGQPEWPKGPHVSLRKILDTEGRARLILDVRPPMPMDMAE